MFASIFLLRQVAFLSRQSSSCCTEEFASFLAMRKNAPFWNPLLVTKSSTLVPTLKAPRDACPETEIQLQFAICPIEFRSVNVTWIIRYFVPAMQYTVYGRKVHDFCTGQTFDSAFRNAARIRLGCLTIFDNYCKFDLVPSCRPSDVCFWSCNTGSMTKCKFGNTNV